MYLYSVREHVLTCATSTSNLGHKYHVLSAPRRHLRVPNRCAKLVLLRHQRGKNLCCDFEYKADSNVA